MDQVVFKSYLQGTPSKLELSFFYTTLFNFEEGDIITLTLDNVNLFYGYIFTNIQTNDNIKTIVAYDQIRYLTCRDTISYSYKTANQVISMLASDLSLKTGTLEDTKYTIPYRLEENQKILDIIYTALNLTTESTGSRYIFFDDFGKLSLKSTQNMTLPFLLDCTTSNLAYSYQTSIDDDVYNSIKVSVKDSKTGFISTYTKYDQNNKNKWGTLQYFKRLPNTYTKAQAEEYALSLLNQKNRLIQQLEVTDFGDPNVRAGNVINIQLQNFNKPMIVSYCKHIIKNNQHTMQLTLQQL